MEISWVQWYALGSEFRTLLILRLKFDSVHFGDGTYLYQKGMEGRGLTMAHDEDLREERRSPIIFLPAPLKLS